MSRRGLMALGLGLVCVTCLAACGGDSSKVRKEIQELKDRADNLEKKIAQMGPQPDAAVKPAVGQPQVAELILDFGNVEWSRSLHS